MTVEVNVHWRDRAALFVLAGACEADVFELLEEAFVVARVDAQSIVVDMREAAFGAADVIALRRALERADVDRAIVAVGDADHSDLVERLGDRVRIVRDPRDAIEGDDLAQAGR